MNIVLVEPKIPQNTGNIGRLCAATGSKLHLVGELGFRTDDKYLKRAGLDYWKFLDVTYHKDFAAFEKTCAGGNMYMLTTKGNKFYSEASFAPDDYLVFGSETTGLSEEIRDKYSDNCLKIPIIDEARSLNLGNCVGILLFESLRQCGFPHIKGISINSG